MSVKKVALLFPGQGACYPGVLKQAAEAFPQVGRVVADVDEIALKRLGLKVSDAIWDPRPKTIEEILVANPDLVQLAIFGTSVAVYRLLESRGLRPDVLIGHSFGEIAALVCGGAFTVAEGADIICDRTAAARLVTTEGYMAALGADAAVAAALVGLVGNHDTVIAGENGDTQTVLSGVRAKMDRLSDIARILNVGFLKLNSPAPFHSPLMEPGRAEFGRQLQRYTPRPLTLPVFSPIFGRYYKPADRLTECLADHLVQPVRFAKAVRQLYSDGVRIFVECGALDALAKLSAKAVPAADVTPIVCLGRDLDEVASIGRATKTLRDLGKIPEATGSRIDGIAPTALREEDAEAFWRESRATIRQFLDEEYERFRARVAPASPSTPPPVQPPRSLADRDGVLRALVTMYAEALEYPEDVFTEDVELEAELGIDSVKQTELLARLSEKYRLPARPADFKLSDYNTMRKVVDFVVNTAGGGSGGGAVPEPVPERAERSAAAPIAPATRSISRDDLFRTIVSMYAAALEYPEEVFTEDVELEAELGIDSVKQTELLARLSDQYALPSRPADFRLADYNTLGKVVDFVVGATIRGTAPGALSPSLVTNGPVSSAAARRTELLVSAH
jgi:malonyl CoA-acyl carrier protein transacylase